MASTVEAPSVTVTVPIRVRYHECDTQGVVFNANYLAYLDMAVVELCRELFGGYEQMVELGADLMLVQSNLTFRRPARADDDIVVTTRVEAVGTTSLRLASRIERDGELLLESSAVSVFVDPQGLHKVEPPPPVRAAFTGAAA